MSTSPIDLHITNEDPANEDKCVAVINIAEHMCNHDEFTLSSVDETEFKTESEF